MGPLRGAVLLGGCVWRERRRTARGPQQQIRSVRVVGIVRTVMVSIVLQVEASEVCIFDGGIMIPLVLRTNVGSVP